MQSMPTLLHNFTWRVEMEYSYFVLFKKKKIQDGRQTKNLVTTNDAPAR
jgi:hypothetical protein